MSRPLAAKARLIAVCAVLLAGLSLLTACKKQPAPAADPNDPNFIVASVGQWTVTRADLNKQVDDALAQHNVTRDQVPPAQLPVIESQLLRFLVLKKILLDKGATMKLPDIDKEVADKIDSARNSNPGHTLTDDELNTLLKKQGMTLDKAKANLHDILTMQAVLDASTPNTPPSDEEIDALYNAHKDAFNVPPMVRASRVLILSSESDTPAQKAAKKKQIDAARARVMKGEDFSKVAMEVSQDRSSAPKGGDMGQFPRGENEPGFDDVAFKTKVNTVSPVFNDSMGYQFVKVTESTPAGTIPLATARALLAPKLQAEKKQEAENAYAKSLLKDPSVNFYLKLVDPSTQMTGPNGGGAPGDAGPGGAPDQSAGGGPAPAPGPDQAPPPAPAPADNSSPDGNLPAPGLSSTNSGTPQQPSM